MSRGIITISETGVVIMPTAPIWMTQFEIADLFGMFSCDVRKAIRSIYKNKELNELGTMKYLKQPDGISYDVYNIEVIIAVAFRICSKESVLFRRFIINEISTIKKGRAAEPFRAESSSCGAYSTRKPCHCLPYV